MASPNVVSFAVDQKLYDPKSGKPFNWKRAYSPNETSAAGLRRLARPAVAVLQPGGALARTSAPRRPTWTSPFSVKPDKKLGLNDVMHMTRDKCEGTIFDPARGLQGGPFANPNFLPYGFKLDGKTVQHVPHHQRQPGRVRHRDPGPRRAARPGRRHRLAGLRGTRTRPASCPSTPA